MLEVKIKKKLPGFQLDVEFCVNGNVLTLFGPSGSGKSMTLRCISGLLAPDEGHIKLNGRVLYDSCKGINLSARERKTGHIFQNYALFPHLNVWNNIIFGIERTDKKEAADKVKYLLDVMGLKGLENRFPHQLSGGQQQRVTLARALAMEPEVLLMDEPFSALDSNTKAELEKEIFDIQQYYQGSVLFVTHDLSEAYRLSAKIAVYDAGKLLQIGDKREIVDHPANRKVACLTGTKNFLRGYVIGINDTEALIRLKSTEYIFNVLLKSAEKVKLNDEIVCAIRPEYIGITENHEGNFIFGRLERIIEGISSDSCVFKIEDRNTKEKYESVSVIAEINRNSSGVLEKGKLYKLCLPYDKLSFV